MAQTMHISMLPNHIYVNINFVNSDAIAIFDYWYLQNGYNSSFPVLYHK